METFDLLKSHIEAYTRKDGTVVQAHDDKRVAAVPRHQVRDNAGNVHKVFEGPNAKHEATQHMLKLNRADGRYSTRDVTPENKSTKTGSAAPAKTVNAGTAKWPMHVKSSEKLASRQGDGTTHHVGGFEAPANGKGDHTIQHDGKTFSHTGKSGTNAKTGEASFEYKHEGDGEDHRAWVTKSGHLMND